MPRITVSRPTKVETFRERLQRELAIRCCRNPRYSLRGFANFLGTDHATLSQILRGKRAVTPTSVRRLGARIGLTGPEIAGFIDGPKPPAQDPAAALDWPAFAILELMGMREFRPDVGWIERVLGVPADEINVALQHLLRLGLLRMVARDKWIGLTDAMDLRVHGAATIAVTAAQLARILSLSEKLLREAQAASGKEGDGDKRLYHLELHCFPVSAPVTPRKE